LEVARKYNQGKWFPRNPHKYAGDPNNIVYRSSWELRFFNWADQNPAVVQWVSEETIVPYLCETDNKMHRYFVDITIKIKTATGEIRNFLVEIKPWAQTQPPKPGKKKTKRLVEETETFIKNQCKWRAARAFAKKRGAEFIVLTEKDLGIG
jgi:hypothetical protein